MQREVTSEDIEAIGREAGADLFAAYERHIDAGNWPIGAALAAFDAWAKQQVSDTERRLSDAGLSFVQLAIWRNACVSELNGKLLNRKGAASHAVN